MIVYVNIVKFLNSIMIDLFVQNKLFYLAADLFQSDGNNYFYENTKPRQFLPDKK